MYVWVCKRVNWEWEISPSYVNKLTPFFVGFVYLGKFSPVSGITSLKDRGLAYFMVILGVSCTVMGLSVNVINFFL